MALQQDENTTPQGPEGRKIKEEVAVDGIVTQCLLLLVLSKGLLWEEVFLMREYQAEIKERLEDMTRQFEVAIADAKSHSKT